MGAILYQYDDLLTLLSNFCQVAMVLYIFLQNLFCLFAEISLKKMTWNHGISYNKITLKINITIGYTFVFTVSVLKASSKFIKVRGDSFINFAQRNIPVMFLPDSNPTP